MLEVVCSKVRIPEIIRGRVPGRRASDGKSPAAVRAETVTRYDQKTSTGWTEVLPWCHIGDRETVIDQILWSSTVLAAEHDDSEVCQASAAQCAAVVTGPGRTCGYGKNTVKNYTITQWTWKLRISTQLTSTVTFENGTSSLEYSKPWNCLSAVETATDRLHQTFGYGAEHQPKYFYLRQQARISHWHAHERQ